MTKRVKVHAALFLSWPAFVYLLDGDIELLFMRTAFCAFALFAVLAWPRERRGAVAD